MLFYINKKDILTNILGHSLPPYFVRFLAYSNLILKPLEVYVIKLCSKIVFF